MFVFQSLNEVREQTEKLLKGYLAQKSNVMIRIALDRRMVPVFGSNDVMDEIEDAGILG